MILSAAVVNPEIDCNPASNACTFVPITNPRFVRAVEAVTSLKLLLASKNDVESTPSNVSAFKFVTFVVLATVNGAVPVATVEMNVFADTVPLTVTLAAVNWPLSVNPVNVGESPLPTPNVVLMTEVELSSNNVRAVDVKSVTAYVSDPVV